MELWSLVHVVAGIVDRFAGLCMRMRVPMQAPMQYAEFVPLSSGCMIR